MVHAVFVVSLVVNILLRIFSWRSRISHASKSSFTFKLYEKQLIQKVFFELSDNASVMTARSQVSVDFIQCATDLSVPSR